MALGHARTRRPSTAAPVRPSAGGHQRKRSTITYVRSNNVVLRRAVEPGQYVSIRYSERLAGAGIEPSLGRVGDSNDNALAEAINGLFKTEVIRAKGPWRTIEQAEYATPLRNGSTGSVTAGYSARSETSRQRSSKQ